MKIISINEIRDLTKTICEALNRYEIKYLLYGSYAYSLLTKDSTTLVNDIDVVISDKTFNKVIEMIVNNNLGLKPIKTSRSIHANSLTYTDKNGESFDISFDSFEYYFKKLKIDLDNYFEINMEGINLKLIRPKDLIKVYKQGIRSSNTDKIEDYQHKLSRLESLKY